jgi:O-antigen/teichoic acid export membrane protein
MSDSRVVRRVRAHLAEPLFRGAYSLMANTLLTSVLGLVFWIVAARLFPSSTVGRDSVLVASMVTLSSICQLNLGNALVRFLPTAGTRTRGALLGAYALSGATALLAAAAFVLIVPRLSDELEFLSDDLALASLFVASVLLWGVFALQDAALTALRRAPWVVAENALFGVLKLAALPILLAAGAAHGVFVAWVVPMALLLLPVNYLIFTRVVPRPGTSRPGPTLEDLGRRALARFLAQDYLASIMGQAAVAALPLIVIALLGSAESAWFYMPFMIVTAFDLLFFNIGTALTVEGALAEQRADALAHAAARRFAILLLPGVVVMVAAAPLVLLPFGSEYADNGAAVLRLLALSSIFQAAVTLYVALLRLRRRGGEIAVLASAQCLLRLGLAVVLGELIGLEGIALAWLVATALVACAILPRLVRSLRSPRSPRPGPAEVESDAPGLASLRGAP